MISKPVVLVTGGSGLVGRAIEEQVGFSHELRSRFDFVFLSSSDGDLEDKRQTSEIFSKHKPTRVIHLAAKVGGLFAHLDCSSDDFFERNNNINMNVLWCCTKNEKIEKCISCLSTCVFPDSITYPIDETKLHSGEPHHSNKDYAYAKRLVDTMNGYYNIIYPHCLFTSVIPTNIYGINDNFHLEHSHVIPGLVHKCYLAASEAKKAGNKHTTLIIYGSGKPLRQFVFAPDLAKLVLWALDKYSDKQPLILSPDDIDEISIESVAKMVCSEIGSHFGLVITLEFDLHKSDGQFKKTASNKKLRSLYEEFQFTPIEEGIKQVVEWFCSNYPNVRK